MKKEGFISMIVLVVVAIVLLRVWFDFDVFKWLNTPDVKEFFFKVWDFAVMVWERYVRESFESLLKLVKDFSN